MRSRWVQIDVKVERDPNNESEYLPSADEVAAEVRERMEDIDLDTGWKIVKVSGAGSEFV